METLVTTDIVGKEVRIGDGNPQCAAQGFCGTNDT